MRTHLNNTTTIKAHGHGTKLQNLGEVASFGFREVPRDLDVPAGEDRFLNDRSGDHLPVEHDGDLTRRARWITAEALGGQRIPHIFTLRPGTEVDHDTPTTA